MVQTLHDNILASVTGSANIVKEHNKANYSLQVKAENEFCKRVLNIIEVHTNFSLN